MDAIITDVSQLLMQWGVLGVFIAAFLAGTVIPFSSELILVAIVKMGAEPISCVIAASFGNTLGGMTCYYIGHLGKIEWVKKYFGVKQEKLDRVMKFMQGKGSYMALFTFIPFVGETMSIVLGLMRSNVYITSAAMFVGKMARYIVILFVSLKAIEFVQ